MTKRWRNVGWGSYVVVAVIIAMTACGGDKSKAKSKKTTPVKAAKGTDHQVYAPLPYVMVKDIELPFLLGLEGITDKSCLQTVQEISKSEDDVMVKEMLGEHQSAVTKSIRDWFVDDLAPMGLTDVLAGAWSIEIENAVMLQAAPGKLRFVDNQQCVGRSGKLDDQEHIVTTLFGAKVIHFKTTLPIDYDLQQEMLRVTEKENMTMESDAFFVYEEAKDRNGEPLQNAKGDVLFVAPDQSQIPESQVPAPENRLMEEWQLVLEKPIFFGYREMPKEIWRKESKKNLCDVFLVWDDVTPRPPECAEYQESSFLAKKVGNGKLLLTINTNQKKIEEEFAFGETKMLQIDDRILLWLSPKEVEEGCQVRLNSLVLSPEELDVTKSQFAAIPERPDAEDDDSPKAKKEEKKKKKKKKRSSNKKMNLDDYLAEE